MITDIITKVELINGADTLSIDNISGVYEIEDFQVDLKENVGSTFMISLGTVNDKSLLDRFPNYSTQVKLYKGENNVPVHIATGFLKNKPTEYEHGLYQFSFELVDYTAKTQSILINTTYENKTVSYIVNDLHDKYLPQYPIERIDDSNMVISITFKNKYLYDCLDKLAKMLYWNFAITKDLKFRFHNPRSITNPVVLTCDNCAMPVQYNEDTTYLATRLRVEGASRESMDQTKTWKGDGVTKVFAFGMKKVVDSSTGKIEVTLNNTPVQMGIKFIDNYSSTIHYLYNTNDCSIETDLVLQSTDTLKAVFRYKYPYIFYLNNIAAQQKYGIVEKKISIINPDEVAARNEAQIYLSKYSTPVYKLSVLPFSGVYNPGEVINVKMPELNIDGVFKITNVLYSGVDDTYISLKLESWW